MAPADGTPPFHRRLSPSLAYDSPPLLAIMTVVPLCVNHGPRAAASPFSTAQRRRSQGLSGTPRLLRPWPWGQHRQVCLLPAPFLGPPVRAPLRPEVARRSCPWCATA